MAWQTPKTNWGQPGQTVPGADDFNRIEGNTQHLKDEIDSHMVKNATLSALGHVNHAVLTAMLMSNSWTGTTSPYSQSVTVNGITSTDTPIIDIVLTGTYFIDDILVEEWGYIYRAVTGNNSITFYATEKPTIDLPIQIKVVR